MTENTKPMLDIMIDIECMDTRPTAALVGIGAVQFDLATGEIGKKFYTAIHLTSSVLRGGTMDPGTVMWWLGQTKEAQQAIIWNTLHVDIALQQFRDFVLSCGSERDIRPWGNSASFDVTIVETAMARSGIKAPWFFTNQWCYRTVKAMFKAVPEIERAGTHHNAADDALHQVRNLLNIKKELSARKQG